MQVYKILFLTDYYYPTPTSIGVCDDAIIKELVENGCTVDVVCFGENNVFEAENLTDKIKIFHVRDRLSERFKKEKGVYKKIGNLICRISQIIFMHWFPMTSLTTLVRYYKIVSRLIKLNSYDKIISTYAPFEASYAAYRLKKNRPDLEWTIYILDTFTNRGASKYFSEKWNDIHGWRWERKFFPYADKIITLKCHQQHHSKTRYDNFRHKMYFVDIPLFDPFKFDNVKEKEKDEWLHFIYTGRIDSHWYSPKVICELFEKIANNKNWKLHFFGDPSDCASYLDNMNKKTKGKIIVEGFVERSRIEYEIKNADILVSFCHSDSDMIQSKIFDYMSSGNKIIHLTNLKFRDSARDYYKNYPWAMVLDVNQLYDTDVLKALEKFIETFTSTDIGLQDQLFPDNRPNTTVNIIINN